MRRSANQYTDRRKSPPLAAILRKGREPGEKKGEKKEGSEIPRRTVAVLVGQADGSKGEHPVHANDIPEVQRAVFRGYQRRP